MKAGTIVIEVIENKKTQVKTLNKQCIIDSFNGIKNGFPHKNEIAEKLLEVLPDTETIIINRDRNDQHPEEPVIICKDSKGMEKIIKIINHHKIIWAIINGFCE